MIPTMDGPLQPHHDATTTLPDGRRIGWASYGEPDGDVVFWFHGTPGARAQLPHDVDEHARDRGIHIVAVERPGTGHSTPHRYERIVDFVPDLERVADDVGAEQFACVGLSGGGPFVLACAHELPQRMAAGVVLGGIGPTRGDDTVLSHTLLLVPAAPLLNQVREPLGNLVGGAVRVATPFADVAIGAFFSLLPGDRHAFRDRPLDKRQFTADLISAVQRSGLRSPIDDLILFGRHWGIELSGVKVPITFYGGNSDVIVPYVHAERQAKRVHGSRLRTIEGSGHFAGYTDPAQVLDDVREHWPI